MEKKQNLFGEVFTSAKRQEIALEFFKFLAHAPKTRSEMRTKINELKVQYSTSISNIQVILVKLRRKGIVKTATNQYSISTEFIQNLNKEWAELLVG